MSLQARIRELLEQETARRPKATVAELAEDASRGVDAALSEWVGPIAAGIWWREWAASREEDMPEPWAGDDGHGSTEDGR